MPHARLLTRLGRSTLLIMMLSLLMFSLAYAATTAIEEFEDESDGATSFTTDFAGTPINFNLTNTLAVENFGSFGHNSSSQYVDSGFAQSRSGSVGSFSITSAGYAFIPVSLAVWTSDDGGSSDGAGEVTFIGTLAGGGTVSAVINIVPTGYTGADWDEISFTGTNLENQLLTDLEFQLNDPAINFVALDSFEFTPQSTAAVALVNAGNDNHANMLQTGILMLIATASLGILYVSRKRRMA